MYIIFPSNLLIHNAPRRFFVFLVIATTGSLKPPGIKRHRSPVDATTGVPEDTEAASAKLTQALAKQEYPNQSVVPRDDSNYVLLPADTWCGTFESPAEPETDFTINAYIPDRTRHLWRLDDVITYGFMPYETKYHRNIPDKAERCDPTDYRKDAFKAALKVYLDNVPLNFQETHEDMSKLDFSKPEDRKKVNIRIAFGWPVQGGAWGWTSGGEALRCAQQFASLFLGGLPSSAEDAKDFNKEWLAEVKRTIYHEIGHAFGLDHEHESPLSPTSNKLDPVTATMVATLFDEKSIMLYSGIPYKADPKKVTKDTLFPSHTDFVLLMLMYPDVAEPSGAFAHAAKSMGFNQDSIDVMLGMLKEAFEDPTAIKHNIIDNLRKIIADNINEHARLAV
ncbi:ZnMc domain-containing protein [Mycena indigotica]|uniref:ZnMc domain-containing protein n=1 Tax=Mycena indigotica TaxID=2126181 RepID=A0A8H6W542_9AGAR|nr:ZnMc domain-containing protein [Mycena indigotica]KAF7302118.1 ZnMc domain-containing protein [Mycena indigotica]